MKLERDFEGVEYYSEVIEHTMVKLGGIKAQRKSRGLLQS